MRALAVAREREILWGTIVAVHAASVGGFLYGAQIEDRDRQSRGMYLSPKQKVVSLQFASVLEGLLFPAFVVICIPTVTRLYLLDLGLSCAGRVLPREESPP
jgi:hypothetical protein